MNLKTTKTTSPKALTEVPNDLPKRFWTLQSNQLDLWSGHAVFQFREELLPRILWPVAATIVLDLERLGQQQKQLSWTLFHFPNCKSNRKIKHCEMQTAKTVCNSRAVRQWAELDTNRKTTPPCTGRLNSHLHDAHTTEKLVHRESKRQNLCTTVGWKAEDGAQRRRSTRFEATS